MKGIYCKEDLVLSRPFMYKGKYYQAHRNPFYKLDKMLHSEWEFDFESGKLSFVTSMTMFCDRYPYSCIPNMWYALKRIL